MQEVDEMQHNGRVFKKQVRGEYNWLTFAQVDTRARNLGNGLTALGQERKKNIVIFAETRAEWMIALQSCFANSFPGIACCCCCFLPVTVFLLSLTQYFYILS